MSTNQSSLHWPACNWQWQCQAKVLYWSLLAAGNNKPIQAVSWSHQQAAILLWSDSVKLGKMVAHSIFQGCPGFPYLAPAMYYYVATWDINQASAYASIVDIPNREELNYVEKVHTEMSLFILPHFRLHKRVNYWAHYLLIIEGGRLL